ncbi:hypothetical protein FRC19_005584 [Serendipita sp. 401]|nr:hypothetical protein FRC19_005584 [Serendipita sp. 401]KAG9054179.1 hypothetical protein FS842_005875 [Serendipita sp. 407]
MPFGFGSRRRHAVADPTMTTTTTTPRHRRHFFRRTVNPDRRAAGLKASLANPNTTHEGRKEAKEELHAMGRSAHVPLSVKIKRTLGIRSTPRRQRKRANARRTAF